MKQLTIRLLNALPAALSAIILAAPAALADDQERSAVRTQPGNPTTFKLKINVDNFPSDFVVPDGYRLPPKVDGTLVQQIYQARLSVPAWHGVHTMTPGVSATGL